MEQKRLITYSLLAHIKTHGTLVESLFDLFVPLVKKALSSLSKKDTNQDQNLKQLKEEVSSLFKLEIPTPVLARLVRAIADEINTEQHTKVVLYNDNSFCIQNYTFDDYDEILDERESDLSKLEETFSLFKQSINGELNHSKSIFDFINSYQMTISKYLTTGQSSSESDFTIEAKFVKFLKENNDHENWKKLYDLVKDIFLGSIISSYIEFEVRQVKQTTTLLLDTNFLIGLLDLGSKESYETCHKLLQYAETQKLQIFVMSETISETKELLKQKALNFSMDYLYGKNDIEDIYNACERKKFQANDLFMVSNHVEEELDRLKIHLIRFSETQRQQAKRSKSFQKYKQIRNSEAAALHDALAYEYVMSKRQKTNSTFSEVNCWFVHNSKNSSYKDLDSLIKKMPVDIRADELLSILWLSSPNGKNNINLNDFDISEYGVNSIIALTLNKQIPKSTVIKEISDNLQKHANYQNLDDSDVVFLTKCLYENEVDSKDQITLATAPLENKQKILDVLERAKEKEKEETARKEKYQEEILTKVNNLQSSLEETAKQSMQKDQKIENLSSRIEEMEKKNKEKDLLDENDKRKLKRDEFIQKGLKEWRCIAWRDALFVVISVAILRFVLPLFEFWEELNSPNFIIWIGATIFSGWVLKQFYDKYRNQSHISSRQKEILDNCPIDYIELESIDKLPKLK